MADTIADQAPSLPPAPTLITSSASEPSPSTAATSESPSVDARAEPDVAGTAAADTKPHAVAAPGSEAQAPVSTANPDAARSNRFTLLAASVAIAACTGAIVGSLGASGLSALTVSKEPMARIDAAEIRALKEAALQLRSGLKSTGDQVTSLRAHVDAATKATSTELSRLNQSFEKLASAQSEPAAKLTKATESLDRIERRLTAAPSPEITGTTRTTTPPPAAKPVLPGMFVRRVYDGMALVETRMGMVEIEPGDDLPGAGRVQEIKRQDGRWVVVTSKGLIVSR